MWISFGFFLWIDFTFTEFSQRILFFHFSLDSLKIFHFFVFSLSKNEHQGLIR